jgi:hypothetical protein
LKKKVKKEVLQVEEDYSEDSLDEDFEPEDDSLL